MMGLGEKSTLIREWREKTRREIFDQPQRFMIQLYIATEERREIFTDGSKSSKHLCAGSATVICLGKVVYAMAERLEEGSTNNIAELKAIINALIYTFMNVSSSVVINSDSEYSIKAITGVNKVIANKELIKDAQLLMEWMGEIRLSHVKAHSGVGPNEMADKFANVVSI